MALDGEKLRKIRTSKGISQEKLALLANVNRRTVQRAEKGEPIALETAAFIAEAVGVAPASLRGSQLELFEPKEKAWDEVILVPVSSGRRVIDAIRTSFKAEITYDVEPDQENVEILARLATLLERFEPDPWNPPSPPSHVEILRGQAEANEILAGLSAIGVSVFLATYIAWEKVPLWDGDTGGWYVMTNTPKSDVPFTLITVSDSSSSHLMRKPDNMSYSQDEIPF